MRTLLRNVCCLGAICLAPAFAQAATQFVFPGAGTPIQDGIDAAAPGDTVFIFNGVYNENNITINKALTLQGQSSFGVQINANSDCIRITNAAGPVSINSLSCTSANNDGIDSRSDTSVSFYDVICNGCNNEGIRTSNGATATLSFLLVTCNNNGDDGIDLNETNGATINSCTFNGNSGDGIDVDGTAGPIDIYYTNCNNNTVGDGMDIDNSPRVWVIGCTASGNLDGGGAEGININGCGNVLVQSCVCQFNDEDGICVDGSTEIASIWYNYCTNNANDGIEGSGNLIFSVLSNTSWFNGDDGIDDNGNGTSQVFGNSTFFNGDQGVEQ